MSTAAGLKNEVRQCSIAIIGAGMAGLGAANTLHQELHFDDFLVIEAQPRAGGRIETLPVGDGTIDLGAQWIHGVDTHLHNIARDHNLLSTETSDEGLGSYVRNDGHVFDSWLVKRVDFQVGRILETCESFVDAPQGEHPNSVGDFLRDEFRNYVNEETEEKVREEKLELFDWHERFQLIDNSCRDLCSLSAKEWGRYSCLGKDGQAHINLIAGYQSIVDVLVKSVPRSKLLLNTPVSKINYSEGKVVISCEDGTEILANHVLVTVSLGVLKQCYKTMFQPTLPQELTRTIEAMGFGSMGKVFLLFEHKWWTSEGFQLLWKKRGDDDVFEESSWTCHISGFDQVLGQPLMLLAWVAEEGAEVMEQLPEHVVGRDCVELLRRFLKDESVPYPQKVYRTTWCSNRWIRGAYSHTTPICDEQRVNGFTLTTPVSSPGDGDGVPRVLFAGEAVHRSHFSTTHGAYESGQDQARSIQRYLNSVKKID